MTNEEFNQQLEAWQTRIIKAGVTQPDGRPIPKIFFHLFLGISSAKFRKMIHGDESRRNVSPETARMVHFINQLSNAAFIKEVKATVPLYVSEYRKKRLS